MGIINLLYLLNTLCTKLLMYSKDQTIKHTKLPIIIEHLLF